MTTLHMTTISVTRVTTTLHVQHYGKSCLPEFKKIMFSFIKILYITMLHI